MFFRFPPTPHCLPLTEQQASVTIPGTNLSFPLSALTANQILTIPGTNITLPAGIQIPTSQTITIPCSSSGVGATVSLAGTESKPAATKDSKEAVNSQGQGWSRTSHTVVTSRFVKLFLDFYLYILETMRCFK